MAKGIPSETPLLAASRLVAIAPVAQAFSVLGPTLISIRNVPSIYFPIPSGAEQETFISFAFAIMIP